MAVNDVYKRIQGQIKDVDDSIKTAREMISFLQTAGENTDELRQRLNELEKKKIKWSKALAEKGYSV